MFTEKINVGLDISSQRISIVEIELKNNNFYIKKYGSIPTPVSSDEGGYIDEPRILGEKLAKLIDELGLKGSAVTTAVGGQQVYTRTMIMPQMSLKDIRKAATYQAMNMLPINIDDASIDVFPLRNFEDEEGKKTEVFFAAVRRQQIDNLYNCCEIAGLKLKRVELEPLALQRVISSTNILSDIESTAILQIGASRSYFAVYNQNIMQSMRSIAFGSSLVFQQLQKDNFRIANYDSFDACAEESEYLFRDLIQETNRLIEYYLMQNNNKKIERIILSGGVSQIKGLDKLLSERLNLKIDKLILSDNIFLPHQLDKNQVDDFYHSYSLAIGLALRDLQVKRKNKGKVNFLYYKFKDKRKKKQTFIEVSVFFAILLILLSLFTSSYYSKQKDIDLAQGLKIINEEKLANLSHVHLFRQLFKHESEQLDLIKNSAQDLEKMQYKVVGLINNIFILCESNNIILAKTDINRNKLLIKAYTDNIINMEIFLEEIEASPYFIEVEMITYKVNKDNNEVSFNIEIYWEE